MRKKVIQSYVYFKDQAFFVSTINRESSSMMGSYRVTVHAAKKVFPFDMTFKVESYEDVTVPAGTFKAFRISYTDTIGNKGIQWYSPGLGPFPKWVQERMAQYPGGPGTR